MIKNNRFLDILHTPYLISYSISDIHTVTLTLSDIHTTTTMACEIPVWCTKTRSWRACTRSATCTAETFIDDQIIRKCCCKQHKPKAIEKLIQEGPHTTWDQRTTWRLGSQIINTHVRVEVTPARKPTEVEHVSRGTITFGPMTEREYLDDLYDVYHEEYGRIGMCGLQHEDDEWRRKYDECAYHMQMIEDRLDSLPDV